MLPRFLASLTGFGRFAVLLAFCPVSLVATENERWFKIVAPEFTVITTLREKEALGRANEFAQFVAALRGFIDVDPKWLPPLTMVVFARERDFVRFQPLRANGTVREVAGFFSRRPSWAVAGLGGTRMNEATREILFHEDTHWFLSAFELPNPVWLEEGLAEVFSTFSIEGQKVSWGTPINSHVEALQLLQPMPLEQLLFIGHDHLHDEGEGASLRAGMTYAQSWAFVHYLIFGQRDVPKGSLVDYVKRLRTGHPDEAFRQAFGGTYAEVDRKLREYMRGGRYYVARQPVATLPALKVEPASAAEVEAALARLRMVGGRLEEAKGNVERAVTAAPDDPRVYELQGELAQELGDAAAAQVAYRTAVEKGSRDFRPYYELASAEHQAAAETSGVEFAPETARVIANRYERAINLNPRFRPAYQGLAGVINIVPAGNPEDERFLEFGLKLFPDDGLIRLGLAVIAKRAGNDEKAREYLARVLNEAGQPSHVLRYARRLETEWMQRDVFGQVDALRKSRKFAEALAFVDEQLGRGVDFGTRQRLQHMRDNLQASHLLEQGNTALAEKRWDDAREKFQALLESNASPILKGQVRRYLEQLEKRGVGKTRASAPD